MKFPFLKKTFESKENLPDDEQFIRKIFQMKQPRKGKIFYNHITSKTIKSQDFPKEFSWDSLERYRFSNDSNMSEFVELFRFSSAETINKYVGIQCVFWLYLNIHTVEPSLENLHIACKDFLSKNTPLNEEKLAILMIAKRQTYFDKEEYAKTTLIEIYRLTKNRESFQEDINLEELLKKYYKGNNENKLNTENYEMVFFKDNDMLRKREAKNTDKDITKLFDLYIDGLVGLIITNKGLPVFEFSLGIDQKGRLIIEQLQKTFYQIHNKDGKLIDKNGKLIDRSDPMRSKKTQTKYARGGNKVYWDKLCIEISRAYAIKQGIKYYGIQSAENNNYTQGGDVAERPMGSAKAIYDTFAQEEGFQFDKESGNFYKQIDFTQQKNSDISSLFLRLKKYFSN